MAGAANRLAILLKLKVELEVVNYGKYYLDPEKLASDVNDDINLSTCAPLRTLSGQSLKRRALRLLQLFT